ncbi:hypothetical protein BC830DRAFT_882826 [Chytriomyces sp. MP71]|nr:hypothetical protein BC830DRAFT_882826 [Chytriomyces sp. MP71]
MASNNQPPSSIEVPFDPSKAQPDVLDVIKNIQVNELSPANIARLPCAKNALLYGIAGGLSLSAARFLATSMTQPCLFCRPHYSTTHTRAFLFALFRASSVRGELGRLGICRHLDRFLGNVPFAAENGATTARKLGDRASTFAAATSTATRAQRVFGSIVLIVFKIKALNRHN